MKLPEWLMKLLGLKPNSTQYEIDLAHSDYLRAKYGIAQPFADEDRK